MAAKMAKKAGGRSCLWSPWALLLSLAALVELVIACLLFRMWEATPSQPDDRFLYDFPPPAAEEKPGSAVKVGLRGAAQGAAQEPPAAGAGHGAQGHAWGHGEHVPHGHAGPPGHHFPPHPQGFAHAPGGHHPQGGFGGHHRWPMGPGTHGYPPMGGPGMHGHPPMGPGMHGHPGPHAAAAAWQQGRPHKGSTSPVPPEGSAHGEQHGEQHAGAPPSWGHGGGLAAHHGVPLHAPPHLPHLPQHGPWNHGQHHAPHLPPQPLPPHGGA
eukprot:CAMPEP_0176208074 /NCGR_PEP_ID=MMETSP0121_2-20121125/12935_1 /TAXON_ID=160619 /ORGANISM="Kryptoperidinium foliaceum, Strain CCMP 1326" /LENGTH=267 /DNA_ID=CAMNT_0017547053 /DNA_START=54 /DNA_END=853 /DNA_ORIENTATION=+